MSPSTPGKTRHPAWRHVVAYSAVASAGVVLLLIAVDGFVGHRDFVLIDWIFGARLVLGVVAVLVGAVGLGLVVETRAGRQTLAILAVLACAAWSGFAYLTSWAFDERVDRWSGIDSPDGTLTTNVVMGGIVDPIWDIRVQRTGWNPLTRIRSIGCVNGDYQYLRDIHWTKSGLRVETSFDSAEFVLDAEGKVLSAKGNPSAVNDCVKM